jgi:hypothetical protein
VASSIATPPKHAHEQQHEKRRPRPAHELLAKRHDRRVEHPRLVAVLLLEPARHGAQIVGRPLQRHAVPKARKHLPVVAGSIRIPLAGLTRSPQIRAWGKVHVRRKHADD